ncbi:DUF2848 domain-containing protein [Sulfitobacter sp. JB4-11]|uniref:DUF2848 domain-containing protein n=1 Tax=Sulfitobacter rhodophyticola TaxID=3238304 RepID=UPI003D815BA1
MHFDTDTGPLDAPIKTLIIAGWTGRDAAAVRHHINELMAIGIPAPSRTPLYYRTGANLLTQADQIDVLGKASSGEAEPLVVQAGGKLWLGLGSDHTDREFEKTSVAASKQMCPKPVGTQLWSWSSVADRLDDLVLSAEIFENGAWVGYQKGKLSKIRPLEKLIEAAGMKDGFAMMCGTLPAIGSVRPSAQFRARLHDPEMDREITLSYTANRLPLII